MDASREICLRWFDETTAKSRVIDQGQVLAKLAAGEVGSESGGFAFVGLIVG